MRIPAYLRPNASAPTLSFRDGNSRNPAGYVRWKVIDTNTGRTLAASEWLPDNEHGIEACRRMAADIVKYQRAHRAQETSHA